MLSRPPSRLCIHGETLTRLAIPAAPLSPQEFVFQRVAVSRDIVAACSASHQKIGALFRRKSRGVNAVVVETSLLIDIRIGRASIGGRIDVLTRCDVRMFFATGSLFHGGNVRVLVGSPDKSPGQAGKSASGNKHQGRWLRHKFGGATELDSEAHWIRVTFVNLVLNDKIQRVEPGDKAARYGEALKVSEVRFGGRDAGAAAV